MKTHAPLFACAVLALCIGCATPSRHQLTSRNLTVKVTPSEAEATVIMTKGYGITLEEIYRGPPDTLQITPDSLTVSITVEAEGYDSRTIRSSEYDREYRIGDGVYEVELLNDEIRAVRKEAKLMAIPGLTDKQREQLRESSISVGMPVAAIEYLRGEPESRSRSGGVGGQTEFLHYYRSLFYFVDGKLERWEHNTR